MGFLAKRMDNVDFKADIIQAKKIPIFNAEGREIADYKAVVSLNDESHIMNIVSDGYQIIQHSDVVGQVRDALFEMQVKFNIDVSSLTHGGARMRMGILLPEIEYEFSGGKVQMRIDIDNSYNSMTGLRYIVGAYRLVCLNGLYVGEKFSTLNHKHTKGINSLNAGDTIKAAVDRYRNRVVPLFSKMHESEVSENDAIVFLTHCLEEKFIPQKYLEKMISMVREPSIRIEPRRVENEWDLYNVITETMTHHASTPDIRQRYTETMVRKLSLMPTILREVANG